MVLACAFKVREGLRKPSGDDERDDGGEFDPRGGRGEWPLDGDAGGDEVGGVGGRPVVELSWLLAPGSSVEGENRVNRENK